MQCPVNLSDYNTAVDKHDKILNKLIETQLNNTCKLNSTTKSSALTLTTHMYCYRQN